MAGPRGSAWREDAPRLPRSPATPAQTLRLHTPVSPTGRGTHALFLKPEGDKEMPANTNTLRLDVYSRITDKIIATLSRASAPG